MFNTNMPEALRVSDNNNNKCYGMIIDNFFVMVHDRRS